MRGALAGAIAGLLLTLTWRRIFPHVGLVAATVVGAAAFGAILAVVFLSLYDGRRRFVLTSLVGWAIGGLAFYGLVTMFARSTQPVTVTMAIASAAAGLFGGAGFGFGWGGRKGALLIGGASFVGLPVAMFLGWWALTRGATWIDASGIGVQRIAIYALADLGFVLYGILLGVLTPLCEEEWVDDTPQTTRREVSGDIATAIHAGTREGRAAASSGGYAAVQASASSAIVAKITNRKVETAAPPLEPRKFEPSNQSALDSGAEFGEDSLEFDESDIALTPYEEQNPDALTEDMPVLRPDFDLGAAGGRPSTTRNLHPDYSTDAASSELPGIGGMNASKRQRLDVEVELEGQHDSAIEMDRDDEYGFLDED
ncbi:MAG: hypothetical protein H6832_18420 [Planctomycetes bacterium]|nr:hypothetical protein [Planctomycetota bacterium]MCB9920383.1 hypothetical protein [Planctomycetota bacterium]